VEVLDNIAVGIGIGLEPNMTEKEIIYELILQGMLELEDIERELLYLRYGLKMDELKIGNMFGMSCEEVQQQSILARQKLEKVLKGTL
jgi:DNA-directed RNA polymerase specialized sigma subunit